MLKKWRHIVLVCLRNPLLVLALCLVLPAGQPTNGLLRWFAFLTTLFALRDCFRVGWGVIWRGLVDPSLAMKGLESPFVTRAQFSFWLLGWQWIVLVMRGDTRPPANDSVWAFVTSALLILFVVLFAVIPFRRYARSSVPCDVGPRCWECGRGLKGQTGQDGRVTCPNCGVVNETFPVAQVKSGPQVAASA